MLLIAAILSVLFLIFIGRLLINYMCFTDGIAIGYDMSALQVSGHLFQNQT